MEFMVKTEPGMRIELKSMPLDVLNSLRQMLESFHGKIVDNATIQQQLAGEECREAVWALADCCRRLGRISNVYIREAFDREFPPFLVVEFARSRPCAAPQETGIRVEMGLSEHLMFGPDGTVAT